MRKKAKIGRQTTCYVIAYDIPDDKRRTKVHKILLGYGKWTQYSLFECFLNGQAPKRASRKRLSKAALCAILGG